MTFFSVQPSNHIKKNTKLNARSSQSPHTSKHLFYYNIFICQKTKIEYQRQKKKNNNKKMLQNQDFNRNTIVFINIVFCIILY